MATQLNDLPSSCPGSPWPENIAYSDIATAFSPSGFQNAWHSFGSDKVSARNVQPFKSLSGLVRQQIEYRKLSEEERTDLLATVAELISWLNVHQLREQDFIRQALIDGLQQLMFRLDKFRWIGWGYTLESLREVIAAYMMLERHQGAVQDNPDIHAMLQKVGTTIKAVYGKLETMKSVIETGDWLLKAYGAAALAHHAVPSIKALLPGS